MLFVVNSGRVSLYSRRLFSVIQVYEEAVVAVGLSIDVWAAFLELYIATEKPSEEIRA